jgi:tRNA(Arg) A34 adenosine deaminase TadA
MKRFAFLFSLLLILTGGCSCAIAEQAAAAVVPIRAENAFMQIAVDEAYEGILLGHGGPFGAVVVRDGEVVGRGHNRVLADHDPTCHGEIAAIRDACAFLGTHDLSGCVLYTTGEPCPMCLYACMWANIDRVYYGCTLADNAAIGFRDERFDALAGGREAFAGYLICVDRDACLELFDLYTETEHATY